MKKVIFVCLLTITVCFSQSEHSSPSGATAANTKSTITPKPAQDASQTTPTTASTTGHTTASSTASSTAASTASSITPTSSSTASTPVNPNGVTTATPPPATTTKKDNETGITTTTAAPPSTHPDNKTTSESTPVVPHPEASTPRTTVVQARGFDGASFVGGIILTLGLIAIGFMGLKYYRAQTERNYHTL